MALQMLQARQNHLRLAITLLWLSAGLWTVAGSSPGAAQSQDDVFRVSGIAVDVSSTDAVTARRQALREGQQIGLERLLRRLVPAEEHQLLPAVGGLPIDRYVQNFEINEEELSTTQYVARLTVAYEPGAVRQLLQDRSLPFAETTSAPLVVLPLYEGPDGPRLWPEEGNPWWQAWVDNLDPERLLRMIMPLGDLQDMAIVTTDHVRAADPGPLSTLARRYGGADVLVVTAVPAPDAAGPPSVRLTARRIGAIDASGEPLGFAGRDGQTMEEVLAEAVQRLQDRLDEHWKSSNLLRFDQGGLMVVDIPITQLSDWVAVSRGLDSLPEVRRVAIDRFAQDNVRVELQYIGDQPRLEQALARLGLALSQEGEAWRLQPTATSPDSDEPPNATSTSS
jgi:hypothetical protein